MDQLEAEGEDEISDFLSSRYGPRGSTPWNLTYNSSGRVGIIAEQQQIEGYYGLLKPNTKLGRIGALKTNAGFSYLLKEGFSSLLKWDCERIRRLTVGSFSARFQGTVQGNFTPEHLILAMLMSDEVDMIPTTMHEVRARHFLRVNGYLCNGPTHIGKQVSVDDFNSYMAEVTTQRNPQNRWHHGFQ
jgi:hypothetical protein